MGKKVVIGLIAGVVSGLFATGGGMVVVPALVYLLGLEEGKARATSLFVILPMVIASGIFYYQNDYIDWKIGALCAIGGMIRWIFRFKIPKKNTRQVFENIVYDFSSVRIHSNDVFLGDKL